MRWGKAIGQAGATNAAILAAQILGLKQKGQLAVGKDADMLLLNSQDLTLDTVLAKGRCLVRAGTPIVWGTFEKPQHSATGG